jgi:hypothetical protein
MPLDFDGHAAACHVWRMSASVDDGAAASEGLVMYYTKCDSEVGAHLTFEKAMEFV